MNMFLIMTLAIIIFV